MCNAAVREAISRSGLKYWQVAEVYGCSDGNFSRKLRRELPEVEKLKILAIIRSLQEQRKEAM